MALTLISVQDGYSVYEDEHGDEVLIALMLPYRRVVMWDDFDVQDAWTVAVQQHRKTQPYWSSPSREAFIEQVRQAVADRDSVEIVWCEACDEAVKGDEAVSVQGDSHACRSCYEDSYYGCNDCGEVVHRYDMRFTLHEESICESCCNSSYSYCEECDGYYHDSYADDHDHDGDNCECESAQQVFSMRNGGSELSQDERVTISLPAGMISDEGINAIRRIIKNHSHDQAEYEDRMKWWNLAVDLMSLDSQWQTKEGNYTKRLSKLAYKSQGLKIPAPLLAAVGNIARDNSAGSDYEVEMTRNLNLSAEDFYHEDSCWWQSYSESRCALKTNGGIGMRTFGGTYGRVTGRAWIMPLRLDSDGDLVPTFDSLTPDAFIVFNGYGDLSGYTPARIVAQMAGMTYRKVGFDCGPMYINNGNGYLVAPEQIAAKYAAGSHLSLYTDAHSNLFHNEQARQLVTV